MPSSLRAITLGKYDLERTFVFLAHHDDPARLDITFSHERVHWFVTRKSTYGLFLRRIHAAVTSEASNVDTGKARLLLRDLVDDCRVIQEAAATYISLVLHGAVERCLNDLLPFYLDAFRRMDAIVTPWFDEPRARCWMAYVVAIISLSSKIPFVQRSVDEILREDINRLFPKELRPDQRFRHLCELLRDVPAEYISSRLRNDWPGWDDFLRDDKNILSRHSTTTLFVEDLLAGVLFPLLKDGLPDAEEEWEESRLQWGILKTAEMFSDTVQKEPDAGAAVQVLNELAEAAVVADCAPPRARVLASTGSQVTEMVDRSHAAFDTVFLYGTCSPGMDTLFLCDLMQGKSCLDLVPLQEKHLKLLETRGISPITILEEEWWRSQNDCESVPPIPSFGNTFFHLHSNPLAFVRRLVHEHRVLSCTGYILGYDTGLLKPAHGLCMVFYWTLTENATPSNIFFHICMSSAMVTLKEYYFATYTTSICWLDSTTYPGPVSPAILGKLADHSILCNYYLRGRMLA